MKYIGSIFVLLLAACATSNELRTRTPLFDQVTNKPSERLAGCVADQLEGWTRGRDISTRPTSNGYSIRRDGNIGIIGIDTAFVIDIIKLDDKSRIQFFSNLAFNAGNEMVISFIRKCI